MRVLSTLLIFFALSSSVSAQLSADKHVSGELYHRVENGETKAAVVLTIEKGWHLYHDDLGPGIGISTTALFTEEAISWKVPLFPAPHRFEQSGLGPDGSDTWVWSHKGRILIYGKSNMAVDAPELTIKGLTCEDSGACVLYNDSLASSGAGADALFANFPPDSAFKSQSEVLASRPVEKVAPPVVQSPHPVAAVVAQPSGASGWPSFVPRTQVEEHSLAVWMLLAFVAGIFLNVMPCVLPVVSLKVLSLVEHAGKDRRAMLAHGLVFASGILLVFAVLAILAATLGLGWGEQFQKPVFIIVMITLIFVFALSLFGLFEFGVPTAVNTMAAVKREGYRDSFFKGILTTLLATPCSGPFLGATLAWALAQPAPIIFAIFMSLGVGMALPYVILTSQPRLLAFLPKPGAWMVRFKQITALILMFTIVYLMFSLPREMVIYTNVLLIFIAFAACVYGKKKGRTSSTPAWAIMVTVAIIGFGAWLAFVPLYSMYEQKGSDALQWQEFTPAAFREHQSQGRSVFVDFTANWCPNCKYNELTVYEHPEIVALLKEKQVVAMKADLTSEGPRSDQGWALLRALGGRSLPFMAIFPADAPLQPHTRFDIVTREDVGEIIKSLP